ncbi:MAG: phenylalanine--tRNA ligase subunit beta [Thermodesulfobacteriota bacterium]
MKASLNWLREYVDIDLAPDELGEDLTMAGFEVENISKVDANLNNVVVGKIVSLKPHPNADKLSLCQVSTGVNIYNVVCGAVNMISGDYVALALEGALLPNGMKIKNTKIRGELSHGMMCSEEELKIGRDSSGIMILRNNLELGKDITSALNLDDYIFEINITPNRPDCLSIIGIAREIAAITGKILKMPKIEFKEGNRKIDKMTSVEIHAPELCPRYSASLITDVTIGLSPFWMRRRLESAGIRPISNVVDVTNYVLMEFGQPLHAFDFDLLSGKRIVVRRANDGDIFTSLDGMERHLSSDTLMICDGEKPVAIGGIMGGLNSEVSEGTSNVLIESAYFNPTNIRKTSKKLGLQTEASYRFERGVDYGGVVKALNRATQLALEFCGGKAAKGVVDQYPSPIFPKEIPLSIDKANKILGTSLKKGKVNRYLKSIELDVKDLDKDKVIVKIPSFRMDLHREIDLIEEVARLDGYDNIPTTTPVVKVNAASKNPLQVLQDRVKDILASMGYYEVVNYSFISPVSAALLNLDAEHPYKKFISIKNPLREDQSVMRTTLIPGLLSTMKTNVYNKNLNLKLFELGAVFYSVKGEELPREKKMLSALATGLRYGESWSFPVEGVDFYDIKGSLENLFEGLNIMNFNFLSTPDIPYLHPGKSSVIMVDNNEIGTVGEVHSAVLEGYELSNAVYIFELDFDLMIRHTFGDKKIKPLSKYPPIYRDIALIVDESVQSKDIYNAIGKLSNKLVDSIRVFDVYRGKSIPHGKKSLAYRIKYQSYERTLTDKEVNSIHEKLVSNLVEKTGARIRE